MNLSKKNVVHFVGIPRKENFDYPGTKSDRNSSGFIERSVATLLPNR